MGGGAGDREGEMVKDERDEGRRGERGKGRRGVDMGRGVGVGIIALNTLINYLEYIVWLYWWPVTLT